LNVGNGKIQDGAGVVEFRFLGAVQHKPDTTAI
jgi:hypothetical protein